MISGASRGLGFALARELTARGAKVVITARGEARLKDSEAKLIAEGGKVVSVCGDVGKYEDARKMVQAAIDNFGRLDILINNAGVSMRGQFAELAPEVLSRVTETNLLGSMYLSRAAVEHLIESKGNVLFISSIAGILGLPVASIYCATKKALVGFAESLRIELDKSGVHVGLVYLGYTEHDPEKRIIGADGSPELTDRPAHHTQAQAARLIIKMIEKRKNNLVMTPVGKLAWLGYKISPALVEKAIIWVQSSEMGIFKRFS